MHPSTSQTDIHAHAYTHTQRGRQAFAIPFGRKKFFSILIYTLVSFKPNRKIAKQRMRMSDSEVMSMYGEYAHVCDTTVNNNCDDDDDAGDGAVDETNYFICG